MRSSPERTALVFLAGVALAGGTVRVWRAHAAAPQAAAQGTAALERQLQAVDSAKRVAKPKDRKPRRKPLGASPLHLAPHSRLPGFAADSPADATVLPEASRSLPGRVPRPPSRVPHSSLTRPPSPLDVDTADSTQLVSLPAIGPTLAHRILIDRSDHGAFGSMEALRTVRGITAAVAARLDSLVTFSGPVRPVNAVLSGGRNTGAGTARRGRRRPP